MLYSPDSNDAVAERAPLGNVLIVEDDGLIAMTIEDAVRSFGARQVQIANSSALALRAALDHPYDCAILDVLIGPHETYEVADLLAQRNIPFMFCTAFTRCQLAERHRERPMLAKPYRDQDLFDWLASIARPAVPAI